MNPEPGILARFGTLTPAGWLLALGALVVVVAIVYALTRRISRDNAAAEAALKQIAADPLEIATMRERATLSKAGSLWLLLVLVNWVFAAFLWSTSMSTLQEAFAALVWIGGTVMFGLFATLCVERRYTIYRMGARQ